MHSVWSNKPIQQSSSWNLFSSQIQLCMELRFTDWNAAVLQWCITRHSTTAPPAHPVSLGLWLPHTCTRSSKCWVTHHTWVFVAYSHSSAAGELNQSWGPSKVHDYEIWKISYCKCRKDKLIPLLTRAACLYLLLLQTALQTSSHEFGKEEAQSDTGSSANMLCTCGLSICTT